ncbi:MAG: hypothetical protein MI975_06425 [Cytophagales bacterium]|nr:hypothetical protein [Cytophagales bacterium]
MSASNYIKSNAVCIRRILNTLLLFFCSLGPACGQHADQQTRDSVCLFIALQTSGASEINEINNRVLCFSYEDKYGKTPALPVKISDWRKQPVVNFTLDKTYGYNAYSVALNDLSGNWEQEKIYRLEAKNETGRTFGFNFKLVDPPEEWTPVSAIISNAIDVRCDETEKSRVEYYGQVSGGKPPYQVTWYVFGHPDKAGLLYSPSSARLEREGDVPMITVTEPLDYYVMLNVIDACGSEKDSMVHVTCDEQNPGKLNVFFEPVNPERPRGKRPAEL